MYVTERPREKSTRVHFDSLLIPSRLELQQRPGRMSRYTQPEIQKRDADGSIQRERARTGGAEREGKKKEIRERGKDGGRCTHRYGRGSRVAH
jgi:hypothetical protein